MVDLIRRSRSLLPKLLFQVQSMSELDLGGWGLKLSALRVRKRCFRL